MDNINSRQIHWFPGHMMKTLRLIAAEIKNVDVVLQLLDARIPYSSINPELAEITSTKPKLYVLNKADLADGEITALWVKHFRAKGDGCVAISSKTGALGGIKQAIDGELEELIKRRASKGMQGAKIRIMVVGIPNVGKSTFINHFCGTNRAKAADKPGVTRGKQWVSTDKYDLLDMPGVLWRKLDNHSVASNLAFIGSIKDDILDIEQIACDLLAQLVKTVPQSLCERYKLTEAELTDDGYDMLNLIGKKRGMLISGGEVNTERAAIMVVDEFRASKLGKVSLERP